MTELLENQANRRLPSATDMAVAVLVERLQSLPKEDKHDLMELLPILINGDDSEDCLSAQKAFWEIVTKRPSRLMTMELDCEDGEKLAKWKQFVGERVKAARVQKGLVQKQLAELTEIPQSHLSRIENGQHSPSARTLERIAGALQIDVKDLDPSLD